MNKAQAREIDRFSYLNSKTKNRIVLIQEKNPEQYKTIFGQVKEAEELMKDIYNSKEINEKLIRKYLFKIDSLVEYFESLKKEGFNFSRLIKGLKTSKKLIVGSVLDELNSKMHLALSECKSHAYDQRNQWYDAKNGAGQSKAYEGARKLIATNPNLLMANRLVDLLESMGVEDHILTRAKAIAKKIDQSLKGRSIGEIASKLEK
jgi:hypothetical protein